MQVVPYQTMSDLDNYLHRMAASRPEVTPRCMQCGNKLRQPEQYIRQDGSITLSWRCRKRCGHRPSLSRVAWETKAKPALADGDGDVYI